jgi:hypothetical protein
MIKRLWAGVAGVALLGAVGATAIVVAGTGGEEERCTRGAADSHLTS